MSAAFKIDRAAMDHIAKVSCAPLVARTADRIATSAIALAGTVAGHPVKAIRYDGVTNSRARSAIILTHPAPRGRQAGRDAAEQAMAVSG